MLFLVIINLISKKEKFNIYLLLLPLIISFLKRKAKTFQIYKLNKSYIYYLLKTNTNLDIKFKLFTNKGCLYTIDLINKKAKYNIYFLLLFLIINFI